MLEQGSEEKRAFFMEIGNTLAKNITAAGEKTAYENNLLWEIFLQEGKREDVCRHVILQMTDKGNY